MSAEERSGWRDEALSLRHRLWGVAGTSENLPMVDLDFLLIEYDKARPVGMIDYKFRDAPADVPDEPDHPSYRAVAWLADGRSLPFAIVFYRKDPWQFSVQPVNAAARTLYLHPRKLLDERTFIRSLWAMRGRPVPEQVLEFLSAGREAFLCPVCEKADGSVYVERRLLCAGCAVIAEARASAPFGVVRDVAAVPRNALFDVD